MGEEIKGPSRGRKQCPNCKVYVGVRLARCVCNFEFSKKEEIAPVPKFKVAGKIRTDDVTKDNFDYYAPHLVTQKSMSLNVLVPIGESPVELKIFTKAGIKKWADKVAEICYERGHFLSKGAIEYYSRSFYRYGTDREKENLIKEVLGL